MENWEIEERIMKDLTRILREDNHSLVLFGKDEKISTFDGRGVSDLFRLLHEQPEVLEDAYLADKIVGKGAAALMALGKVNEVYADIITLSALAMLELANVRVRYGRMVPHIKGRGGTGFCPVETRCLPCRTPAECLVQIKAFLEEMKAKK